jgi:hypothetical protein
VHVYRLVDLNGVVIFMLVISKIIYLGINY